MISRCVPRVITLALGMLLSAASLLAGSRVSDAEMAKLIALPEREQLASPNQDRLQLWFFDNVMEYHDVLSKSAIGSSPLVNLGDVARLKAGFAPPMGRGQWRIEWVDRTHAGDGAAPCWWTYDNLIQFSRGSAGTYLRDDYTCWHELFHALLEPSTLLANPRDWTPYLNVNGNTDPHHVYLEALTQRTVDWLEYLNKTMRFEENARKAQAEIEEYQKRIPGPLPYDVERQIWSRSHDAWVQAWPNVRRIAPLPANLRAEFTRLTGVRLPTVEEAVAFYMNGGIRSRASKPIQVPRWVMHAESLKAVVIIDHEPKNDKSETSGGVHRTNLDVRVLQTYLRFRPAERGNVIFRIEGAEGQAALEVKLGSKNAEKLPGAKAVGTRQVSVDLGQALQDLRQSGPMFRLTVLRGDLTSLKQEETIRLIVDFQDVPDNKGETVYQASKAVFFIHVKPGPPPASASTSGSISSTANRSPAWVLKNVERSVDGCASTATHSSSIKMEGDSMSGTETQTVQGSTRQAQFRFAWQPPAARLAADERVSLSTTATKVSGNLEISIGMSVLALGAGGRMERSGVHVITGCNLTNRGGSGEPTTSTKTGEWTVPRGNGPSDTLDVAVTGETRTWGRCWGVVTYHYTWSASVATTAASAVTATSWVSRQPQAEAKADRILDNPVPQPGEIIPEVPPRRTDPPPPPPKVTVRWYTHRTTGDYRIRLTGSWRLMDKAQAGVDSLEREDGLAIHCTNGFGVVAGPEDAVLDEAMGSVLKGQTLAKPIVPCALAQSKARRAAVYLEKADLTLWYQLVAHAGRIYLLNIGVPGRPAGAPPEEAVELLERLRWMR
jgi:hypothetical protein